MKIRAVLPVYGRDLRLDLFRGIANWAIFLNHIPNNAVNWITTRNYGFSDGAELFVFISGYTAALVYGRIMRDHGFVIGATRLAKRVWQLYVAHILLFVAFTAQVAWVSVARDTPALIEETEMLGFGQNPYQAILEAALNVEEGGGKPVDNAVDGIKAIAAGEKVDYTGASGPCDFDDKGDILDCKFRYEQIKAGKFTVVKIA